MIPALLLWLLGPARAEAQAWALSREVAQVSLEAPEGGLPRESLEPLLQVRQGEPLDMQDVRQDIAILYRVGSFAAVEAVVEPWLSVDAAGEPVEAVRLTYRVIPAPRVGDVEIVGVRGMARTITVRAADLNRGEAFFPSEEAGDVVLRVTSALAAAGWPEASAQYGQSRDEDGSLRIRLRVNPGVAHRYGEIGLAGDEVVSEAALRRWLFRHGVSRGRRIDDATLAAARLAVRDRLHEKGWLEALINILRVPTGPDGGTEDLRVIVDAGRRVQVHAKGRGLPADDELREILGLLPGVPPGAEAVGDLEDRLEAWYRARGWFEASARVTREEASDGLHFDVEARRGRRHVLGRITVDGARTFSSGYVAGALKEAAPETLGKGIVTRESVSAALGVVRDFYRSQGFLEARLSLEGISPGRPAPSGVPLDLQIKVVEGPRTFLASLESEGGLTQAGPPLEQKVLDLARGRMLGQPYNPAALDALAQEVIELYQSRGYLNADARASAAVERLGEERGEAHARLLVSPGEQVRLRSVAIQGNRRTRRDVIARELRVALGEPLTPAQLEQSRSALYGLDLFKAVNLELLGEDDRTRDLVVQVEENQNLLVELGGGLSTDEGVLGRTQLSHRNLAGLGQRVTAFGQAGYGWQGDRWVLDAASPVWRVALRYEAPNLPARGYRLNAELLLNEAVQEPWWRLVRSGASLGLSARWGRRFEAFLDYHYQWRRLEDADPSALVQGEPWWPVEQGELAPDTPTDWRRQGGTGLTLVYDGRDDPLNPSRGTLLTTAFELGDPLSASPAFVKGSGLAEQIVPLGPLRLDLRAAGGVGLVAGRRTTLAVEDRFTLGGSGSLRGFHQDTIGPANLGPRPEIDYPSGIEPVVDGTALTEDASQWVNTGGDTMLALTTELSVPFTVLGLDLDSTSLVLFADLGHIGFLDPSLITTSRTAAELDPGIDPFWRLGVGAGVHVATPIGPAALDIGFNVDPIEARDEAWIVPHLSLGAL